MKPLVSIIIPAFKPTWLGLAIESALAQTYTNLEVLISDDSTGTEVVTEVSRWQDSRIRYMKNPTRGLPGTNRDFLIAQASGKYIKFLFDDDFLLAESVSMLVDALEQSGAKLAFHNRHIVDGNNQLIASPQYVSGQGCALLPAHIFFQDLVGTMTNHIGEPSNIMVEAETLKALSHPFALGGVRRMRFLTDMALYTNFAALGLGIVGVAAFGSAFRRHSEQTSNQFYPGFSAGLFEWELLRRWSADNRLLSPESYRAGVDHAVGLYQKFVQKYPELAGFMALNRHQVQPVYMDTLFEETLSLAYTTIAIRHLNQTQASTAS